KKSRLRRDSESVTFTLSSRGTSAAGAGRKSSTTRTRPISPAVYLGVLLLIEPLSLSPIASAEDADATFAIGEPHRQYAARHPAEAEIALLAAAVLQILGDHAARVEERGLRFGKSHPMLGAIGTVLGGIPFEARLARHRYGKYAISAYGSSPHPMPRPPSSVGGPNRRAEWLTPPRMALVLPRYGSLFANISPIMTAN